MAKPVTSSTAMLAPYLEKLTPKQLIYVRCKIEGMTDIAAGVAAGVNPKHGVANFRRSKAVAEAIRRGMELVAQEVMFTRKEAHEMYMEAHRNASNSMEQIAAITAMVKLHGIAAPEVKEIHSTVKGEIRHSEVRDLSDEQLLQLAKLPTAQLPNIIDGEYEELDNRRPEEETRGPEGGESRHQEEEGQEEGSGEAPDPPEDVSQEKESR